MGSAAASTPCVGVDERDLESTAKCYFGSPAGDRWTLLSKESQAEAGDRALFIAELKNIQPVSALRVLGVATKNGLVFGRVEVLEANSEKHCTRINTTSWIKEGEVWRRVRLPKTWELTEQLFKNGDYSAAENMAENWLGKDPFSIDAYSNLAASVSRVGRRVNARSTQDIVRAALAVNPVDSEALFLAVSHTQNADVSEAIFNKLRKDDCVKNSAAFNLANMMKNDRRRLVFLDGLESKNADIEAQLISTLWTLRELERLEALLSIDSDERIQKSLDDGDASYAAHWGVRMGEAWLGIKNKDRARAWASYASTRDPNGPGVASLIRRAKG